MRIPLRPALALAVFVALIAWTLFSRHQAQSALAQQTNEQLAVPVLIATPSAGAVDSELVLPGNVQANFEAPIYARTSGYLKRWLVDIGAEVKAGQLLAEIEAPEVDQSLRQAEADLASAESNQKIAQITSDRWRGLRDSDSVSKQEADEKLSGAQASDAALGAARANVQRLRELKGFKRIVAPFDGIVTARDTDIGQLVAEGSAGKPLFRVADTRRLRVYVRVPQSYAAAARVGVPAELSFPDRPGRTFSATLVRTSSAIDAASRTLLAQLEVDNTAGELLPGAYVEARFKIAGTDSKALRVPTNTLLYRSNGLHVATVNEQNVVLLKPVAVGRDFGGQIEIVNGLSPDDRVIMSPPDSITDSTRVHVVTQKAAA